MISFLTSFLGLYGKRCFFFIFLRLAAFWNMSGEISFLKMSVILNSACSFSWALHVGQEALLGVISRRSCLLTITRLEAISLVLSSQDLLLIQSESALHPHS